jgi:two-component system cell cycle response regulator
VSEAEEKRPCLIMIRGDYIGQVYEISSAVMMMGRGEDMGLVVSDGSISRRHAMIINRGGKFYMSDLASTNGTNVNKAPVLEPAAISEGDKLTLGDIICKFSFQDEEDTEYHSIMRDMAVKDGLTRIYNKRHFLETLDKEFDFPERHGEALCVLMFDIDHFKRLNDTYGHPAGDHVLRVPLRVTVVATTCLLAMVARSLRSFCAASISLRRSRPPNPSDWLPSRAASSTTKMS